METCLIFNFSQQFLLTNIINSQGFSHTSDQFTLESHQSEGDIIRFSLDNYQYRIPRAGLWRGATYLVKELQATTFLRELVCSEVAAGTSFRGHYSVCCCSNDEM